MFAVRRLGRGNPADHDLAMVRGTLLEAPGLAGRVDWMAVLDPHEVIRDDLAGVWHPTLEGVGVEVVRSDGHPRALESNLAALGLIRRASPRCFGLVREHCGAICLIRPIQVGVEGLCVSTTSKAIPGLVYLSPVPTILSAESLVHESAHLALGLQELESPLFLDPDRKVQTPLRPDPRPISGLLHQIWVLVHLRDLYRDLLSDSSEVVRINRAKIEARLQLHAKDLADGVRVVNQLSDAFTAEGWRVVKSIAHRAEAA